MTGSILFRFAGESGRGREMPFRTSRWLRWIACRFDVAKGTILARGRHEERPSGGRKRLRQRLRAPDVFWHCLQATRAVAGPGMASSKAQPDALERVEHRERHQARAPRRPRRATASERGVTPCCSPSLVLHGVAAAQVRLEPYRWRWRRSCLALVPFGRFRWPIPDRLALWLSSIGLGSTGLCLVLGGVQG